jgi:radical SAM protein with 4Fe4S-binding SPASM domain
MVPKIKNDSMSPETFEKMLWITERLFEKGEYETASFRLSGGEPLLVFNMYKDIVTKCVEKHKRNISFGVLSNLVILNDDIIEWLLKNNIGIQVSLDDLNNSKPLHTGESSAKVTLQNIKKLSEANVSFSINTVLDTDKTENLADLVEYICSLKNVDWGLNASYTLADETKAEKAIKLFKDAITELNKHNYNVYNRLRFYNMTLSRKWGSCTAGTSIFALGTNLEVWPCQTLIDKPPLGYFDAHINDLLKTSEGNRYFYNRTLLPQCTDCNILEYCRGGCRSVHQDEQCVKVTCKIRREIVNFILQGKRNNDSHCGHDRQLNDVFENIIKDYIKNMSDTGIMPMFVETPALPID